MWLAVANAMTSCLPNRAIDARFRRLTRRLLADSDLRRLPFLRRYRGQSRRSKSGRTPTLRFINSRNLGRPLCPSKPTLKREQTLVKRIFCEIFDVVQFSTFAQYPPLPRTEFGMTTEFSTRPNIRSCALFSAQHHLDQGLAPCTKL